MKRTSVGALGRPIAAALLVVAATLGLAAPPPPGHDASSSAFMPEGADTAAVSRDGGESPRAAAASGASNRPRAWNPKALLERTRLLRGLHRPLPAPAPGDWLASRVERGRSFDAFRAATGETARGERRVLYVQPLGDFSSTQLRIIRKTARFMAAYFGLPVRLRRRLPLSLVPPAARRRNPFEGQEQINARHILYEILEPRRPADATACIAFTTADLWPRPGWNFVFGLANKKRRVGVWSLYRNGDPHGGPEAFRLCLLRTLKTGTHETGHMLGLKHCVGYLCAMNGANHRAESDRRPAALCPVCLAKVCWATGDRPARRYRRLASFYAREGFPRQARFCREALARLEDVKERGGVAGAAPVPESVTPSGRAR